MMRIVLLADLEHFTHAAARCVERAQTEPTSKGGGVGLSLQLVASAIAAWLAFPYEKPSEIRILCSDKLD